MERQAEGASKKDSIADGFRGRSARLHDPDRADDNRNWAQRDRDRILYTTALRRLDGVTQVASAGETHVFHNRLTHTFEVAQIARRLAEHLQEVQREAADALMLDADVAEAAALAHDLGHPPFGHVGEKQLDECVVGWGNPDGFEGNAQSFRILTKLSIRHEAFRGLNLSRATLAGVLKYPWFRETGGGKRQRKYGAYHSEEAEFRWVREGAVEGRRTAEAELMDWADDIAYSVHDLFDFFRAGLIPADRLRDEEPFNQLAEEILTYWKQKDGGPKWDKERLSSVRRSILSLFPLDRPFGGTREERAKLRGYTSWLIDRYVRGQDTDPPIRLDPRAESGDFVVIDPGARMEVDFLKELTAHFVIRNARLATLQHGQRRVIQELFEALVEDVKDGEPSLFPVWAVELLHEELKGLKDASAVAVIKSRVVADILASLTEAQTLGLHGRLMGHQPGSLLDRLP